MIYYVDDEWGIFEGKSDWIAGAHGLPRNFRGCDIYFSYRCKQSSVKEAGIAAERWRQKWLKEGAVNVNLECIII